MVVYYLEDVFTFAKEFFEVVAQLRPDLGQQAEIKISQGGEHETVDIYIARTDGKVVDCECIVLENGMTDTEEVLRSCIELVIAMVERKERGKA